LTVYEVAPRQPILLDTSSPIDVGVDALAEVGISEHLRRPLVSTELAATLARRLRSLARYERNTISDI
jgi:hypothetical protein